MIKALCLNEAAMKDASIILVKCRLLKNADLLLKSTAMWLWIGLKKKKLKRYNAANWCAARRRQISLVIVAYAGWAVQSALSETTGLICLVNLNAGTDQHCLTQWGDHNLRQRSRLPARLWIGRWCVERSTRRQRAKREAGERRRRVE